METIKRYFDYSLDIEMRSALMLLFCFAAVAANGQRKFIIGTNDDYSILLNEDVSFKSIKTQNGHVDYYVLKQPNSFFMLTVTRAGMTKDPHAIYNDDFRIAFMKQCNCELFEYQKTSFNNFEAVIFKIKTTVDGKLMEGYSLATVNSTVLYSINFFTLESNLKSLTPEFQAIMNSLVFK